MAADGWTPLALDLDPEQAAVAWQEMVGDAGLLDGEVLRATVKEGATSGGKPAVGFLIRLDLGDDNIAFVGVWTTWNLIYTMARAFEARVGPAS